jgi:hypothetical protein
MMRGIVLIAMMASLSGCGVFGFGKDRALRSERVLFDGIRFRSDVDTVSEDRRDFTVTVRGASQSPGGAQEAAEFEAVKHCLGLFGGSEITWTVDPYQDPETLELGENDTLTIAGRCTKR